MIRRVNLPLILGLAALAISPLRGAEELDNDLTAFLSQFHWVQGPGSANMSQIAAIQVPQGFQFTGGEETRTLLEAMGNLTSGTEMGFLAPTSMAWFVVFRFSEEGYVKDDDKDKLDPAAMLKTIQRGTEYSNKERRRLGFPEMRVVGWEQEPSYNAETHNLEWAIRGESQGEQVVNYNTRILGRRGVMEVKLVVDPGTLQSTLPDYKQLLATYSFQAGQRYAEYQPGDRVARYGLAALITGGAVAVAAKTGLLAWVAVLFKKLGKLIVIAVVAVAAFFKRLITGRTEPKTSLE